jgi:hypothetical protein
MNTRFALIAGALLVAGMLSLSEFNGHHVPHSALVTHHFATPRAIIGDDDSDLGAGARLVSQALDKKKHHAEWGTDMNQAIAILARCQIRPGLYSTHIGAQCKTLEDSAIKLKVISAMHPAYL